MSSIPPLEKLPALPRDAAGPIFAAPWQAHAFAMTLALHESGAFTWEEWAAALSSQIKFAQRAGDPDAGDTYYLHWLNALESLLASKGLTSDAELGQYAAAWQRAAERTPHGMPVLIREEDFV